MLSHPVHAMRLREHVLSQQVLEFLIEQQDHFLVGMQLSTQPKRPTPAPSIKKPATPVPPSPPPRVRADPDLMLPSDSDDDMPEGGYFVIESNRQVAFQSPSPANGSQAIVSRPPSIKLKVAPALPSRPPKPAPAPAPKVSRPPRILEHIMASDSDEEAPPGGYEVRVSEAAERRGMVAQSGVNVSNDRAGSITRRRTVPSRRLGDIRARVRRLAKEAP
jgi:hypothetical protein